MPFQHLLVGHLALSAPMKWIAAAGLVVATCSAMALTRLQPAGDDEVLEVLPAVTRSRPQPSAGGLPPAQLAQQEIGRAHV